MRQGVLAVSTTYEAVATRSGEWWAIEVRGVPGAFTQARRLSQVPAMARAAVADLLDVATESVAVSVVVEGPEAVLAENVAHLRENADELRRRANEETRQAARALLDRGLPQRDVAELLHVSQPYVSMLKGSAA